MLPRSLSDEYGVIQWPKYSFHDSVLFLTELPPLISGVCAKKNVRFCFGDSFFFLFFFFSFVLDFRAFPCTFSKHSFNSFYFKFYLSYFYWCFFIWFFSLSNLVLILLIVKFFLIILLIKLCFRLHPLIFYIILLIELFFQLHPSIF